MKQPTEAQWLVATETQVCPLCGRGPFKVLATHVWQAHEIHAAEIREMAGLTKHASICSPESSELHTERANRLVAEGRMPVGKGSPGPHVYSRAGREIARENGIRNLVNGRKTSEELSKQAREYHASLTPEERRAHSRKMLAGRWPRA